MTMPVYFITIKHLIATSYLWFKVFECITNMLMHFTYIFFIVTTSKIALTSPLNVFYKSLRLSRAYFDLIYQTL